MSFLSWVEECTVAVANMRSPSWREPCRNQDTRLESVWAECFRVFVARAWGLGFLGRAGGRVFPE